MEWVRDWIKDDAGFLEEAKERALPKMRYIFYRRGKGFNGLEDLLSGSKSTVYYGYCTHCGKESRLPLQPTHNDYMTCPQCGRWCMTKADGRGTKHLYDDGGYNFIRWKQGALYIIHCYIAFDYRTNKYQPTVTINPTNIWRFAEDCFESWATQYGWDNIARQYTGFFKKLKTIGREKYNDIGTELTFDTIKGSWLENSRLFEFMQFASNGDINDIIAYLVAYQKHPNIANLVNERQYQFVREYVFYNKALANRIVDWRKVKPHEMLRVQKEELPILETLTNGHMHRALIYQKVRAAGQRLNEKQLNTLSEIYNFEFERRPLKDAIKRKRIIKALNYINSQKSKDKRLADNGNMLHYWEDYLKECDILGYNLNDDSIYYPTDLMKAHERTMKLIKIVEDEKSRKEMEKRLEQISWMTWQDGGIMIRPAESANELRDEGASLSHCVGGYAVRHRNGQTAIFFIRRSEQPETSWFTLELDEKAFKVKQNRGLKNCDPPQEVKDFVERWLKWLPIRQKQLKKEKKAA